MTLRPHNRMCIRMYIINFRNQQTNQIKTQEPIETKETEEKRGYIRKAG